MQMTTSSSYLIIIPTFLLLITIIPSAIISQQTPPPPPPPSPESNYCNGIFITCLYTSGSILKPTQPKNQPYRFESTLTILNNGAEDLKSWRVFVGFQHSEEAWVSAALTHESPSSLILVLSNSSLPVPTSDSSATATTAHSS
ncbi:hypothetical protein ACFE04_027741 [Oxalis oulophora]